MMLTSGCGLLPWQAELGNKLPVQMPRAIISYHWPRADLDQLLCLRVDDITSCQWSGGFPLNKDQSFHIHMRYMYMYVMYMYICNVCVHVHVLVGPSLEWSLALCESDSTWQLELSLSLSLSHTTHHTHHTTHHRGTLGHSIFVRCNITLKGATHHVVFSDATLFPTPFRLENLSQIGPWQLLVPSFPPVTLATPPSPAL